MTKYEIIETSDKKYYLLRYFLYFIPVAEYFEDYYNLAPKDDVISALDGLDFLPYQYQFLVQKKYDSFEEVEKKIIQIEQDYARKNKKIFDQNIYLKIKFSDEKRSRKQLYIGRLIYLCGSILND